MAARSCPVPGCTAAVKVGHLMCPDHWRLVSEATRRRVQTTWKALRDHSYDDDRWEDAFAAYREATAQAVAEVQREEALNRGEAA